MSVQCPHCEGEKRTFVFQNRGDDYRDHISGWQDCKVCDGKGVVSLDQYNRIDYGRALRDARILRGLSLRDAAKLLGMKVTDLSSIENGRVPDYGNKEEIDTSKL